MDSNNLTKTKNWSGRNEVTETSGRLHPLWPQNKWLNTPRTTDYRHIRQDGWIQTELAFTLAKNATKSNPFQIIQLQTTRKENNWQTEEALARTAVTQETERIKGSDPSCLWWWLSTINQWVLFKARKFATNWQALYLLQKYRAVWSLFHSKPATFVRILYEWDTNILIFSIKGCYTIKNRKIMRKGGKYVNYGEIVFRCSEKQSRMTGRQKTIDNNRKQPKKWTCDGRIVRSNFIPRVWHKGP